MELAGIASSGCTAKDAKENRQRKNPARPATAGRV